MSNVSGSLFSALSSLFSPNSWSVRYAASVTE